MSSLVEDGAPRQYSLPLTLLPSTTLHLLPSGCGALGCLRSSSQTYYAEQIPMNPTPVWHVNSNKEIVWPMPVPLNESQLPFPQNRLENGISEQNPEPPKPEKPKWEEEQYPNIGKSILLKYLNLTSLAIDTLSNHLPFLLIQPLPKSILSSKIELCLFPTTHPSFPRLPLHRSLYRTFFRAVRWFAPVILNRSLRSFGSPSGIKGIGLEITCLRVIKIEDGRRLEARWTTSSSPWDTKTSSEPGNKAEEIGRIWSGWFYFDVNRKGLIVRHVIENVNNQRNMEEKKNGLKDILARTVSNGRAVAGEGFGSVSDEVERDVLSRGTWMRNIPRIFPNPSPSNIFVSSQTYC